MIFAEAMLLNFFHRLQAFCNRTIGAPMAVVGGSSTNFDTDAVAARPQNVKLRTVRTLSGGRFNIKIRGSRYECFLHPSPIKRLFVFLSAAGRTSPDTNFNRISWYPTMNGHCLYIDDPMYKRYSGRLTGGWYYGDGRQSYLHGVARIVKAIATANAIHPRNIIFIGSSASGYASLYVADLIAGSVALAYNPQIRIRDWSYAGTFSRVTGMDLSAEDKFGRNCLRRIAKNRESRFFITCNMASPDDFPEQIKPWLDELGESPAKDLVRHGNVHFLLHDTPSITPHHIFPNAIQTCFLLTLLLKDGGPDSASVAAFYGMISEIVLRADREHFLRSWAEVLSRPVPEILQKPTLCDKRYCLFRVHGLPSSWHYELIMEESKRTVTVAFHIEDTATAGKEDVRAILLSVAKDAGLQTRFGTRLEMFSPNVPIPELHERFCRLVEATAHRIIAFHAGMNALDAAE